MTRLIESWIKDISGTMRQYDEELKIKTGTDLAGIGEKSAGADSGAMADFAKVCKVAVIPITTGQGIIGSFTESVAAVSRHLGFETFITRATDVAGIAEAHAGKARVLFLADDNRFIGLDLSTGALAENSICTARGFVAGLECAAGSLGDRKVLVIGCGEVGREMLNCLNEKNVVAVAYDSSRQVLEGLRQDGIGTIDDPALIAEFDLILDASSEGGWMTEDMLKKGVLIAAPGVPLSLDEAAYRGHHQQLIHDLLPIGIASMFGALCR